MSHAHTITNDYKLLAKEVYDAMRKAETKLERGTRRTDKVEQQILTYACALAHHHANERECRWLFEPKVSPKKVADHFGAFLNSNAVKEKMEQAREKMKQHPLWPIWCDPQLAFLSLRRPPPETSVPLGNFPTLARPPPATSFSLGNYLSLQRLTLQHLCTMSALQFQWRTATPVKQMFPGTTQALPCTPATYQARRSAADERPAKYARAGTPPTSPPLQPRNVEPISEEQLREFLVNKLGVDNDNDNPLCDPVEQLVEHELPELPEYRSGANFLQTAPPTPPTPPAPPPASKFFGLFTRAFWAVAVAAAAGFALYDVDVLMPSSCNATIAFG